MPKLPVNLSTLISKQIKGHRHFFINSNVSHTGMGITVICGGWEQCAPDYVIERDQFRFHAIEFVVRGRGNLHVFGHDYELGPGMLFSYGPGVAHRICSDANEPLEKYFVDFKGSGAKKLVKTLQTGGV